jgi:hypothetical protein
VRVGPLPVIYSVHLGILAHSPVLSSKCNLSSGSQDLDLPDVDPGVFELVIEFLYQGTYDIPTVLVGKRLNSEFRKHAVVYSLAKRFCLGKLAELAIEGMEKLEKLDFETLLSISREVYVNLPSDEVWFRAYLTNEVTRAAKENRRLVDNRCVLHVIQNVGGMLAVDLFRALLVNKHQPATGETEGRSGPDPHTNGGGSWETRSKRLRR